MTMEDDTFLTVSINALQSSVKQIRSNALVCLENRFRVEFGSLSFSSSINERLLELLRILINLIRDPSELIQEKAILALDLFAEAPNVPFDGALPHFFSLLRESLVEGAREEPEEIRLQLIRLLEKICNSKRGHHVRYYAEDSLAVLEKTLADNYASVRIASYHCLIAVITEAKPEFFSRSDPIIDVLLATFCHNQAKVRSAHTHALGYAIQYGNQKRIMDIWQFLAQRVIDSSHLVRQAVFSVLSFWMTDLRDRYSFWNRFVPLLLSGLFDDLSDIRAETVRQWTKVGEQYAAENREEMKQKFDLDEAADGFPDEIRPVPGCRALVQRVFFNILPSILNDLKDWKENVRIQSIRLLYQLMLHSEQHMIILLDRVIPGLCQVAKDESKTVVAEVISCGKLIGYFVGPEIYEKLLIERMENSSHLVLLDGILKGVSPASFLPHADTVLTNLNRLAKTRQEVQQFYLFECAKTIIALSKTATNELSYSIFRIIVTVRSLADREEIGEKALDLCCCLSKTSNFDSSAALYERHAATFLTELIQESDSQLWLASSFEHKIIQKFLMEAGLSIFLQHFSLLYPVLKVNIQPQASARVCFDIYQLIISVVQLDRSYCQKRSVQVSSQIIPEFFFPTMTWMAGRANAVARAACCTGLAVLLDQEIIDINTIDSIRTELINKLVALGRDECQETQRAAVRIARLLLKGTNGKENISRIHAIFIKGLDESTEVRFESLAGLRDFFVAAAGKIEASVDFPLRWLLEESCRLLMTHMEDSNAEIANTALDCLKEGAGLMKDFLQKLLIKDKNSQQPTKQCDLLSLFLIQLESSGDR